jgi:hypothetical protein
MTNTQGPLLAAQHFKRRSHLLTSGTWLMFRWMYTLAWKTGALPGVTGVVRVAFTAVSTSTMFLFTKSNSCGKHGWVGGGGGRQDRMQARQPRHTLPPASSHPFGGCMS